MSNIYDLARSHVEPDPADDALFKHYVDTAIQAAERATGVALTEQPRSQVFQPDEISAPRPRQFYTPGLRGGNRGAEVVLKDNFSGRVMVKRAEGGRWVNDGWYMAMDGIVNFLDRAPGGCCISDGPIMVAWREPGAKWPWPPLIVQGILMMVKFLYEHRGDTEDGTTPDPITESGAGKLWARV